MFGDNCYHGERQSSHRNQGVRFLKWGVANCPYFSECHSDVTRWRENYTLTWRGGCNEKVMCLPPVMGLHRKKNEDSISVLSLRSMTWIFTCILNGGTDSKQVTHVKAMAKWLCVKHTESNGSHVCSWMTPIRKTGNVSMFWLGKNQIPPATDINT